MLWKDLRRSLDSSVISSLMDSVHNYAIDAMFSYPQRDADAYGAKTILLCLDRGSSGLLPLESSSKLQKPILFR